LRCDNLRTSLLLLTTMGYWCCELICIKEYPVHIPVFRIKLHSIMFFSQCIRILPGVDQFRNWHPTSQ